MESIGSTLRERFDRIVVENEMLRAGFAAFPYLVLRDVRLSVGGRLAYAILLMYAWQEKSCFPGQQRMALDMGISSRHLRRYLTELRDLGYITWRKVMPWGTNTYVLHDVRSKLHAEPKRTRESSRRGPKRPVGEDISVRLIDSENKTQNNRQVRK